MKTKEIPASGILLELIRVRLSELIQRGAMEANLPPTAVLNVGKGVWVVPDEEKPE